MYLPCLWGVDIYFIFFNADMLIDFHGVLGTCLKMKGFFFFCNSIRVAYFPDSSTVRGKFWVAGDEL